MFSQVSFEKIKIDKPSAYRYRKIAEMTQINKIINKKGDTEADTTEMLNIIRDNCEQLHTNKLDNRNWLDPRNVHLTKTESWSNRKSEQTNIEQGDWISSQKVSISQEIQTLHVSH